jgi:hypothetical protein
LQLGRIDTARACDAGAEQSGSSGMGGLLRKDLFVSGNGAEVAVEPVVGDGDGP